MFSPFSTPKKDSGTVPSTLPTKDLSPLQRLTQFAQSPDKVRKSLLKEMNEAKAMTDTAERSIEQSQQSVEESDELLRKSKEARNGFKPA